MKDILCPNESNSIIISMFAGAGVGRRGGSQGAWDLRSADATGCGWLQALLRFLAAEHLPVVGLGPLHR